MSAPVSEWDRAAHPARHRASSVRSILLPLDGSAHSRTAVPVARELARVYGATLHVACMAEHAPGLKETPDHLGLSAEERHGAVFHHTKEKAVEMAARLIKELPEVLTVMSTHTGHVEEPHRFGAITESIFATRPRRIVLMTPERGHKSWNVRRILLAHDGTPACHAATIPTAELARLAGAEVIALHVAVPSAKHPHQAGSFPAPRYVDQPQHEWPAWTSEFMNRVLAAGVPPASLHFQLLVTRGQAGSEAAQVARARSMDLAVLAWHGHFEHHDCASRVVIRTAGCPVLLICSARE
jgi:nucleotide-binding universal stress UspA family protein